MVHFTATILKFEKQGEKTGWTYIEIPAEKAVELIPGNKKTFRVKGKLDQHAISQAALLPMGNGDFILPLNSAIRKAIGKRKGEKLFVQIALDKSPILPSKDLVTCLKDEPEALAYFRKFPPSHQNYFTKWIESAKTEPTKAKRIAQTITALYRKQDFGEMLRSLKKDRDEMV